MIKKEKFKFKRVCIGFYDSNVGFKSPVIICELDIPIQSEKLLGLN